MCQYFLGKDLALSPVCIAENHFRLHFFDSFQIPVKIIKNPVDNEVEISYICRLEKIKGKYCLIENNNLELYAYYTAIS